MKIAIIACKVFNRDISYAVAVSKNLCDVFWLVQGLHNTPDLLREKIKLKISEIEKIQENLPKEEKYEAIVLAYGLCSNGIVGVGSDVLPVVAPRCDDCMALFLGSQKRYLEIFENHGGLYWYNPGWIENGHTPSKEYHEKLLIEYTEKYGEENAEYLLSEEVDWVSNYSYSGYINSPFLKSEEMASYTKRAAKHFGWEYLEFDGSMDYLMKLVDANFNETDFLVCPKGMKIAESYDERKIKAE